MKILITGATGTVGGQVMRLLQGQGHQLRVLVRDRARATFLEDVEIIEGDLTNADDVRRALQGVERAFLNLAPDNGEHFASVAGELGLKHAVLLSSFTVDVPLASGDANYVSAHHRLGEQALIAARVPSTFLRAAGFDYNILMWARDLKNGVIRAPYPDVRLPIVDPADIAACAAAALLAATPPTGTYAITGPEKLSVRDQADILSQVLGRELRVERISEGEARKNYFAPEVPAFVVTSILETMSAPASALDPSDGVQILTGQRPRTFRDWAVEHRNTFEK